MSIRPQDLLLAPDVDPQDVTAIYRAYGFESSSDADRNLKDMARTPRDHELLSLSIERLLEEFGSSVDPDAALANMERFVSTLGNRATFFAAMAENPAMIGMLATVFGGSPHLTEMLIRYPDYLHWLVSEMLDPGPRSRQRFVDEARAAVETWGRTEDRLRALHRFQHREILRIGTTDLAGGASLRGITNELSWLADAIIQVVFEEEWRRATAEKVRPGAEFAVIGVGKLGGEELNFSSDIDIFYIFSGEAHADFAVKLARRMTQVLGEPTGDGGFYRVDLRLRPEGSKGALATSIWALGTYYDSWGETFERLALTKARVVAGHPQISRRFTELTQAFVYRKYLDHAAIDEIRDIKGRIDAQVSRTGSLESNIKLGRGGIREVEFFVQALQVLYGGSLKEIRVRSTLAAIDRLEEANIIERAVARRLREAYVFLRNTEHKLQIVHQLQTHILPGEPRELRQCAGRMRMSLQSFQAALDAHRHTVHQTFQDLFAGRSRSEDRTPNFVHRFVSGTLDEESLRRWLGSVGFEDVTQTHHHLCLLRDAPRFGHSPTRMKNLLANVLERMFDDLAGLIRPDLVVTRFERLAGLVGARESLYVSLLENPRSISRLCRLFALSDYLSDILLEAPQMLDFIVDDALLSRPMRKPSPSANRRLQEFSVGAQYFFGFLSRKRASRILTRFAEQQLERLVPGDSATVLYALGKFGERELNYRSDLDVVAFHDGDYARACRVIERAVESVAGQFKLDLRLRPEGTKGSLVWNRQSYRRYLEERAEVWERVAFTKARYVAGNVALARDFQGLIADFVYGQPFGAAEVERMNHIRYRMERELGKEEAESWDLKVGRGGLVDIEFLAQFCQIRQRVAIPNTSVVLKKVGLPEQLRDDYEFLRDVESMLRLRSSRSASCIQRGDWAALELMLGVPSFQEAYRDVTSRIRSAYERYKG